MHFTVAQYWPYLVLIFVIWLLSFLNKINPTKVIPFCACMLLLLMAVLRVDTGADYPTYTEMHDRIALHGDNSEIFSITEPLYFLLIRFGALFSDDPWVMFALTALVIYTFLFLAVEELSSDPTLSVLLYILTTYYFISLNQVRQSISLTIFLFSLKYLIKKPSMWKYMLVNLIGLGFHYSAIMAFVIYPLARMDLKQKTLVIILILSIVLSPVIEKILVTYLGDFDTVYAHYFQDDFYMEKNYSAIVKVLVPNLLVMFTLTRVKEFSKLEYRLFLIYFFDVIYFNVFFGKHIFIRPGMYFEITTVFFVPLFLRKFFDFGARQITEVALLTYYFLLTLFGILILGGQKVVPYKLIF